MSENKNAQKDSVEAKRPVASPEQVRSFRTAYAILTKKAVETGERAMFEIGEDGQERIWDDMIHDPATYLPNAAGGSVIIDTDFGETYGWAYGYDEGFAQQSGKLGSFSETTTEDGIEQDMYEFYPDSNIEKLHFVHGYGEGEQNETTHVGWLTPAEIEDLTIRIEDAHLEYRNPPQL